MARAQRLHTQTAAVWRIILNTFPFVPLPGRWLLTSASHINPVTSQDISECLVTLQPEFFGRRLIASISKPPLSLLLFLFIPLFFFLSSLPGTLQPIMFFGDRSLPLGNRCKADNSIEHQSYNGDSPSELVMENDDYVGVTDAIEKDSVAIINPDGLEQEDSDQQSQDLPLANDCMFYPIHRPTLAPQYSQTDFILLDETMTEMVLPPLSDEPKILEDAHNTWTVQDWRTLGKKEHGPIFQAGGFPWCVMQLFRVS